MRALANTKTSHGTTRQWRLTKDGEIRSGYGTHMSCPLAAVANDPASFANPLVAIRTLGLKPQVGQDIWDAADFGSYTRPTSTRIASIRAEMITALKLTDRTDYA